jgi:PAS domain S-box-containing protein
MDRHAHRVRSWIVYSAAAILAGGGAVSFARRVTATEPVAGVEWVQSATGPVVLAVEPGSPAWEAGLIPGDLLARVDGRAVTTAIQAAEFPWRLKPGGVARLDLQRSGGTVTVELQPGWVPVTPEPPIYGYLSLVGLAFLISGSLIAGRWSRARGATVYALMCGSLFALLVYSPTGRANATDWVVSWVDLAAGAFAPALLMHLALVLSRTATPTRRVGVALSYAIAVGLFASGLWMTAMGGGKRFADPVAALETRDRLQMLFLAVAVLWAAVLFSRSYSRSASAVHRSQMRWMLWGIAAGLVPFILFYAVPWSLKAEVPGWARLSVFPLVLVPAAFTAALGRYRLDDLDLVLRRGLTEVTAVFFTGTVYAISQILLREEEMGLFPLSKSTARYVGIVLTVVSYPQIRSWVRVWVDRSFYKKKYSYRATLLDWARELNLETDLNALTERIRQRVRATLDLPEAQVLLRTGERTFEGRSAGAVSWRVEISAEQVERLEHDAYDSVPERALPGLPWARFLFGMRVKGRLRAVLAISEREGRTKGSFSSEDRALLSTLAAHAATAIEVARLLQEVREGAEHVAQLQSRQASILESSGVGLLLVENGRIMALNRALEEIYGVPRDQAIGRELAEVFPVHLLRAIEREARSARTGDEGRLYRYSLVNRGGQPLIVNISISPERGEQPGPRVISFDDVTERVKLEDQVVQQERLASLGMLAAGVAHEINTPLTGISSYAQMLIEDLGIDDARRSVLEKIETQTRRASDIANSLLNLARPERSAFEALSVNDTVTEAIQLLEPQLRARGVRLESRLEADLPPIRGHKAKLQQVVLNLLINAADAVGSGGQITLETRSDDARVVLDVTDNGVGIGKDDLARIFDPFFTTKGRGKGSGLGLSISYGIVREHGGALEVESEPGEYTRFRVTFPRAGPAQAAPRGPRTASRTRQEGRV